jgi:adenylosuccinate synthase
VTNITAWDLWDHQVDSLIVARRVQERLCVEANALDVDKEDGHVKQYLDDLCQKPGDWLRRCWAMHESMRLYQTADVLKEYGVYDKDTIIFEGAQGVLLDETHGFPPHTTWSNCTYQNAEALLREANWQGDVTRVGVTRCYATRHGAGPLPTEDTWPLFPGEHNTEGPWQGTFRYGPRPP